MFEVSHRGEVTLLRLDHGKANALDLELCTSLTAELERLKTESGAIVLCGSGKIFSAGVDLLRLLAEGADYVHAFLPALSEMFEKVFFYPKPVVAALNGHAIAGGCVLACAGDRRLMAGASGRIGVTELLVGVPFPPIALKSCVSRASRDTWRTSSTAARRSLPRRPSTWGWLMKWSRRRR